VKLNSIKDNILVAMTKTSSKRPVTTTELLRYGTYEEVLTVMSELKAKGVVNNCIVTVPGKNPDSRWWKVGEYIPQPRDDFVIDRSKPKRKQL
jgi:hypothetical protein